MVLVKQYITWVRFMAKPSRVIVDPFPNVDNNWGHLIKFTETNLGNIPGSDSRFLGIIEYDDVVVDSTLLEQFCFENSVFGFKLISNGKAESLCNEWYGQGSFSLDEDKFSLIDKRSVKQNEYIEK